VTEVYEKSGRMHLEKNIYYLLQTGVQFSTPVKYYLHEVPFSKPQGSSRQFLPEIEK
jgi:hypothetical protein